MTGKLIQLTHHTKTVVVVAGIGSVPVAVRGTGELGVVVPGPRRVKKLSQTQSAAFHTIYGGPDCLGINRLRLRCFRCWKCKNRLHLTVGGVF
jgi:hypothetical protein